MISATELAKQLEKRWQFGRTEQASWWSMYWDVCNFAMPYDYRYFETQRNKGWDASQQIYDSTATLALNDLASGMMSGITDPGRPWFNLSIEDRQVRESKAVKVWLSQVTDLIHYVLKKSNIYSVLPGAYKTLAGLGTAVGMLEDNFKTIVHAHAFATGEYVIETDYQGNVNTLLRKMQLTAGQLVNEFGYDNCSGQVQSAFKSGNFLQWFTVGHAIEPRSDRDEGKIDKLNMPFRSVYWEFGNHGKGVLREGGYKTFPCFTPRWEVVGGDIYGRGPTMFCIGDIKSLQMSEFRCQQAIDYLSNPPVQIPASMRNRELQLFPGGINYYENVNGAIQTAFDVKLDISKLLEKQAETKQRIEKAHFNDLFRMISEQSPDGMTATEVAARNQEKLILLGPVFWRLTTELCAPIIEITFEKLANAGMLPVPPQEMQGHSLDVDYISILAQAIKMVDVSATDGFVTRLGQIAEFKPEIIDTFDADQWALSVSDKLGVPPELIISGNQLAMIRNARQQAQMQAHQAEMMNQGADTVNKLGSTPTQDGTLGGAVANRMGMH